MSNFIKNIKIKSLFDEKDILWELGKVNVLVGKNGLGKSTILNLISTAVTQTPDKSLSLCKEVMVEYDNGEKISARKNHVVDIQFLKYAMKKISNSDEFSKIFDMAIEKTEGAEVLDVTKLEETKDFILKEFSERFNRINEKINGKTDGKIDVGEDFPSFDFEGSDKKITVELISTVNMSANSVNILTTSSGKSTTLLDFEMEKEIERLNSNEKNKKLLQKKLISSLNNIFIETNKTVCFVEDKLEVSLRNGKTIAYSNLSSGERQVIFIFLKVINGGVDNSLILMDEPEISLHLSWQEKLLSEIVSVNDNSQIIIVTHSPAIVMNGWLDSFIDIKSITHEISI